MTRTLPVGPTTPTAVPRRSIRSAVLGAALAAGLILGTAACSTSQTAERVDPAAASAATAEGTAAGTAVTVPTEESDVAISNEGDVEAAYTGESSPALVTALPGADATTAPPVSTAGPIAPVGNINDVVAEVAATSAAPVALAETADFGGQVGARLTAVTPIQATAIVPGEISGPAIAVTVEIDNGSADAIGLGSVTVTLTDSAGNPASGISADSAGALAGALGAGDTASGMYVFSVPTDLRSPITVTVSYSAAAPTVVFTGEVASG